MVPLLFRDTQSYRPMSVRFLCCPELIGKDALQLPFAHNPASSKKSLLVSVIFTENQNV